MKKFIMLPVLLLTCSICLADQAAWISKVKADAAVKILSRAGTVRHYCEPCGDKGYRSQKVLKVRTGWVDYDNADYYEVIVNETPVDLAYVYVLQQGKWTNLAMILEIGVSGVSRVMPETVKDKGQENLHRSEVKDFELESGDLLK
ncbi:MAG TPA: hypothetical protein PK514_11770 [Spirochaetota bacterium]|nr:hypothetical protein [Spirochaetota bacterium]